MTMQLVAIYRSASYSPGRHRSNDAAIMDATTARFAEAGWSVERLGEGDVEAGIVPDADLYLNMCQGRAASSRLLELEERGARIYNRPSSVLRCHRNRLVRALTASGLAFPATVMLSTSLTDLDNTPLPEGPLWVKRGDVHAQEAADVVRTARRDLLDVLASFAARDVRTVAIQAHVPGPVIKFYGVAESSFFHAFREDGAPVDPTMVDLVTLRRLAFGAARCVGLGIFGGDAVVAARNEPVLVDLNDWPSFAPVRAEAAEAIESLVGMAAMERSVR